MKGACCAVLNIDHCLIGTVQPGLAPTGYRRRHVNLWPSHLVLDRPQEESKPFSSPHLIYCSLTGGGTVMVVPGHARGRSIVGHPAPLV